MNHTEALTSSLSDFPRRTDRGRTLGERSDAPSDDRRTFVELLARRALTHRAVRHPYLQAMGAGDLPDLRWALADFARHYPAYSAHFPVYLRTLAERLERSEHRATLLENLAEESGKYAPEELAALSRLGVDPEWIVGIAHPTLFERFSVALGVAPNREGTAHHVEAECWHEQFMAVLEQGSPAEALGALGLGTENLVAHIYLPFVFAMEKLGNLSPRDSVFFPLHTAVDEHHNEALLQISADLAVSQAERSALERGMHKALALRDSFWSWLYERALRPGTHPHD